MVLQITAKITKYSSQHRKSLRQQYDITNDHKCHQNTMKQNVTSLDEVIMDVK